MKDFYHKNYIQTNFCFWEFNDFWNLNPQFFPVSLHSVWRSYAELPHEHFGKVFVFYPRIESEIVKKFWYETSIMKYSCWKWPHVETCETHLMKNGTKNFENFWHQTLMLAWSEWFQRMKSMFSFQASVPTWILTLGVN